MDGEGEGEGEKVGWCFFGGSEEYIQSRIQTGRCAKFMPKWFILFMLCLLNVLRVVCLDYI